MRHAYGQHRDQWGDLLLPQTGEGAPGPVAVLVHGGDWQAAFDASQMTRIARDLQGRGWASWNLEYRRVGPTSGGGWPRTGEDVLSGIDHLARIDAPLDLERVALIGFSSGGQLALWAAGERRASVGAVVALASVSHLSRRGEPSVVDFMGAGYDEAPELYAAASPSSRLPLGVPALLVHGADDVVLPPSMSERYVAAAVKVGDDATLAAVPGEAHMDVVDPRSASWAAAAQWLTERV